MKCVAQHYKDDLDFLFDKVFSIHPRPDCRVSMDVLSKEQDYCYSRIRNCGSIREFYEIVQRFFNVMGDGHTGLVLTVTDNMSVAPIEVDIVEGAFVVRHVYRSVSEEYDLAKVDKGDVILFVDGQEMEKCLLDRLQLISFNNLDWGRRVAALQIFMFCGAHGSFMEVTLSKPDGCVDVVKIPLIAKEDIQQSSAHSKERITKCIESTVFDSIEAGYLKYRSCMDRDILRKGYLGQQIKDLGLCLSDVPDIEEICWDLFEELRVKDYRNLIVDLRGNMGGNSSVGQVLFKYLTKKTLRTYDCDIKISQEVKDCIKAYHSRQNGEIIRYRNNTLEFPYNSRLDEDRLSRLQQFTGQIYILIDNEVFSSGEWLASEMYGNNLGTFIGEATGGGGSVPGDQITVVLPNTGLPLHVSYKFFVSPVEHDIPGVVPHIWKRQSLQDFWKGRDTVLEFVKEKCR